MYPTELKFWDSETEGPSIDYPANLHPLLTYPHQK